MAPIEKPQMNIENIPMDVQKLLTDLQRDIESSKNIDVNMKMTFAALDNLVTDHRVSEQDTKDIKEYIRYLHFKKAKDTDAVLADSKAKQDKLYHSSHARYASSGEEKTGGTYNIPMSDRTNASIDANGYPTVDYGKTISGSSGNESFDMNSVERGRQLLSQIPSKSLETGSVEKIEQGKEVGQKLIQMLNAPIDVKNLKTAMEVIEDQNDVEQKVMHASLILAQLRTQQYEIMLGSNSSISVVQNIGGKYESNIDFTSVLQSAKIDGNIWQQAMIVSSPKFTQYLETRTDTQGNLKDPNMKSEDFIKYLVSKYKLSQPLKMSEIQDIKRDPSIDPRDKSILIARVNGGISEESTIHTSVRLANGLSEYVQSPIVQAGLAKFMDNNPDLVRALNQSGVPASRETYGEHYEKWHGVKAEWRDKKDVGQFLTSAMAKNPSGAFAMYALLVGLITWWGGKDGKFGRFFLAAVGLPFVPAMAGGMKDFFYGDDPEGGKKMDKFFSDVMKGETSDMKEYFNKMIPLQSSYTQQIDQANSLADMGKSTKKFLSYQEHVDLLGGALLDRPVSSLFFASNNNETLWSGESSLLPENFRHEKIHTPTMKALLRQLILGEPGNPGKVMNANAITNPTKEQWLTQNSLDQNKLATMTLRQLVAHIAANKSN